MAKQDGIYKCELCGNIISVVEAHSGILICCGKEMTLLEEKTSKQEGKEKHVPIIEIDKNQIIVRVGSIPHPMEEKHYIELIQILKNDMVVCEKRLKPGEKPEAEFCLEDTKEIKARELCNIHGLWIN